MKLSDNTPEEDRLYVLQERDGDYLAGLEGTGWDTVPFEFKWTKDKAKAQRYSWQELNGKGPTITLMRRVMQGHAGATAIRVR